MDVSVWFCCLNPDEAGALQLCCDAFVSSLSTGFPRFVLDAYWEIVTPLTDARQEAFIAVYPLHYGENVPVGGEEPIPWVFFDDLPFWVMASLYILNPLNQCQDGCQLISFLVPST